MESILSPNDRGRWTVGTAMTIRGTPRPILAANVGSSSKSMLNRASRLTPTPPLGGKEARRCTRSATRTCARAILEYRCAAKKAQPVFPAHAVLTPRPTSIAIKNGQNGARGPKRRRR